MKLNAIPWATLVVVVQALIVTIAGAIVVVAGDLAFETYVQALGLSMIGAGALGIGRGIYKQGNG